MCSRNRDFFDLTAHQRPMTGDMKTSALAIDHLGWLVCDGRLLNVSDWQFLFKTIYFKYGSNVSGTQFRLPNPAGRVPGFVGSGDGLTTRAMGSNVGEETHTLTIAEMPTHNHGVSGGSNTSSNTTRPWNDPGHTHTGTTDPAGWSASSVSVHDLTTQTEAADNAGNHTHTFTTNPSTTGLTDPGHIHNIYPSGGSNAHNNMQPTIFLGNLFIYSGKPFSTSSSGAPYTPTNYPFATGTNLV